MSILTGSSWTTIATIGVAFIGIGRIMGYQEGWIAGAIISGAYFGDKVSPLSDTTVIASSSCGVDFFDHIRFLTFTAIPAMSVALLTFLCVGLFGSHAEPGDTFEILSTLHSTFNISPWTLVISLVEVYSLKRVGIHFIHAYNDFFYRSIVNQKKFVTFVKIWKYNGRRPQTATRPCGGEGRPGR